MVAIGSDEASYITVFDDRRESTDLGSIIRNIASSQSNPPLKYTDLSSKFLHPKETNFDAISDMDRSMGSISTFLVNSSSNFQTSSVKKATEKSTETALNHFKTSV